MTKRKLNETIDRVYKIILERFGEPIGDAPSSVGVPDQGMNEGEGTLCQMCGNMHESGEMCDDSHLNQDKPGIGLDESFVSISEDFDAATDEMEESDECMFHDAPGGHEDSPNPVQETKKLKRAISRFR